MSRSRSERPEKVVLRHFPNQRYMTAFNPSSGFFARIEDEGAEEPFWCERGPELLDIAVTGWCDYGCPFCYRKSTTAGSHMPIESYREVLRQARDLGVMQVALGGGNPNQHPEFSEILRATWVDFGIVPNYTTNGRGLSDEVLVSTQKYCGAVAVSAYAPYVETGAAIRKLSGAGVTTNVHFILSSKSVNEALEWFDAPPAFLEGAAALVFLNYKPVGRIADESMLANRSPRIVEFFSRATSADLPWRVGFDTCTATGVARLGKASVLSLEPCDAGRFSMFVSEKLEVFPCSFMVEAGYRGIALRDQSLADIWKSNPAFEKIRGQHKSGGCGDCGTRQHCLGGCPLFPQINFCEKNCTSQKTSDEEADETER